MSKISAVLIVRNEEKNIKDCLESIKWMDEIVVVDQSSTDRTVDICKEYTDKVFVVEAKGYCEPDRMFAVSKASSQWIFYIDADERVSYDLAQEIRFIISKQHPENDCYYVARKTFFVGRWIKGCGWWPGYVVRLFRKGSIKFNSAIHTDGELLTDRIGYLKNPLLHYSYNTIDDWIDKFKRYTTQTAKEYYQNGVKVNFRTAIRELLLRPAYFFILKFFILKGFKDGWRGLFISFSSALTVIVSYFKLIEIYDKEKNSLS